MIKRFCSLLVAGALSLGQAEALVFAISPLVEQPSREDAAEVKPAPVGRPVPPPESRKRELPPNPLWAIPFKQLSNTRERPIFSPSRRPPSPAVVAVPPPAPVGVAPGPAGPQTPELVLIGTVIGKKESIAIFVDRATNNPLRLRTGQVHNGWTLQLVHGREARLEKDRESVLLSLPQRSIEQTASIPTPAVHRHR